MKVLVVTEIRLYREGVADLLRALPDVSAVASASTAASAVSAARRQECDVALLDMSMSAPVETIASLVTSRPALRVVVLGVLEQGPQVVACAEAGVYGYVSRDAGFEDVAGALRSAARGEVACSGRVAAELIQHISRQARSRPVAAAFLALTRREREVLRLIQSGMSNKEIARALDLQLSTVKNHVHNVLAKCGATARAEITGVLEQPGVQYLEGPVPLG